MIVKCLQEEKWRRRRQPQILVPVSDLNRDKPITANAEDSEWPCLDCRMIANHITNNIIDDDILHD